MCKPASCIPAGAELGVSVAVGAGEGVAEGTAVAVAVGVAVGTMAVGAAVGDGGAVAVPDWSVSAGGGVFDGSRVGVGVDSIAVVLVPVATAVPVAGSGTGGGSEKTVGVKVGRDVFVAATNTGDANATCCVATGFSSWVLDGIS